jgi:hypothetical protein
LETFNLRPLAKILGRVPCYTDSQLHTQYALGNDWDRGHTETVLNPIDTKSALITPFYCLVVETYPTLLGTPTRRFGNPFGERERYSSRRAKRDKHATLAAQRFPGNGLEVCSTGGTSLLLLCGLTKKGVLNPDLV